MVIIISLATSKNFLLFAYTDPTRKLIKEGELPKLNLPVKSIVSSIAAHSSRSCSSIEKREEIANLILPVVSKRKVYISFQCLVDRSKFLKAVGWNISYSIDYVKLEKKDAFYNTSKLEIYVDDSLGFTIRVFGWLLPENHILYKEHFRSVRYITLSSLMKYVDTFILCAGVNNTNITKSAFQRHVIPKHLYY